MTGTGFIVGCLLLSLVCGIEYGWRMMWSIHTFRHGQASNIDDRPLQHIACLTRCLANTPPSIESDWALAWSRHHA
jgi:hypothetical protein